MKVKVIQSTPKPIDLISTITGVSYDHENVSEKRVRNCAKDGHLGVFEHAIVTVRIEGISRACLAQLTRHRLFSFNVQSQRYLKVNTDKDWYVEPESISGDVYDSFIDVMDYVGRQYNKMIENGAKAEDARSVLPNAAKTTLYMTGNMREYFNFFNLRDSNHAQEEIRTLSSNIQKEISLIDDQWDTLMDIFNEYIKNVID